ncbi:interactor protein for cytohesin exchange factors 1 isoform X5 [Loxodonta africana]|uniref:interactor protein for cytohesin exchange factors 1 isoform X5 n=1 Tax=Loxodonta africana TaxID=9785 RepID=UPI0030CE88F7
MINRGKIEVVKNFTLLGSTINAHGSSSQGIKQCIALGKCNAKDLFKVLKSKDVTLTTKMHLTQAVVFSIASYAHESRTISKEDLRIDAFELWHWQRILNIPWTANRMKKSALEEVQPKCSLEARMARLHFTYFGHVIKRDQFLEKDIMLGKVEGQRKRVRPSTRWIDTMAAAMGSSIMAGHRTDQRQQNWNEAVDSSSWLFASVSINLTSYMATDGNFLAEKADGFVNLPDFTVERASECKKKHAFKISHPEIKTFYFAAENLQEMNVWLNKLGLAVIHQTSAAKDEECYSESEQDDPEGAVETPPPPYSSETSLASAAHQASSSSPKLSDASRSLSSLENARKMPSRVSSSSSKDTQSWLDTVNSSSMAEDAGQSVPFAVRVHSPLPSEAGSHKAQEDAMSESGVLNSLSSDDTSSLSSNVGHLTVPDKPTGSKMPEREEIKISEDDEMEKLYKSLEQASLSPLGDRRPSTKKELRKSFVKRCKNPSINEKLHKIRTLNSTLKRLAGRGGDRRKITLKSEIEGEKGTTYLGHEEPEFPQESRRRNGRALCTPMTSVGKDGLGPTSKRCSSQPHGSITGNAAVDGPVPGPLCSPQAFLWAGRDGSCETHIFCLQSFSQIVWPSGCTPTCGIWQFLILCCFCSLPWRWL